MCHISLAKVHMPRRCTMQAAPWAMEEADGAELGDRRLNLAWARILTALLGSVGRSFSAAVGEGLRQSASALFHRPGLLVSSLLAGHFRTTARRCARQPLTLVSTDSTAFNYTTHRATSGLGRIADKSRHRGVWAHHAMALTCAGQPLGVLSLRFWVRGEKRTKGARRERPYAEKESFKWEASLRDVEAQLPRDCPAVVISDREADVFEYLRAPVRQGLWRLVRAAWPRGCRSADGTERSTVLKAVRAAREVARMRFEVPRQKGQPGRVAELVVRVARLWVESPRSWAASRREVLGLTVIAVDEEGAPAGVKPLSWTLLTDYPVEDTETALAVVDWYRRRWRVELAHRALKLDGYRVERLQFDSVEALELALATYWVVGWRAMNLALEAREHPELPAEERFTADELTVLSRLRGELVTTLGEAVHDIGKLGGWAGYASSPPPGIKVVQEGLLILKAMVRYHEVMHEDHADERSDTR